MSLELSWLLFWLMVYFTPQYPIDFPVRLAPLCCGHLAEAHFQGDEYFIWLDLPKLEQLEDYGPWDKVVIGACAIAHESVHMHRKDSNEYLAYQEEEYCIETFEYKVGRTPGLDRIGDYYRSIIRAGGELTQRESELW